MPPVPHTHPPLLTLVFSAAVMALNMTAIVLPTPEAPVTMALPRSAIDTALRSSTVLGNFKSGAESVYGIGLAATLSLELAFKRRTRFVASSVVACKA